jgi:hypothetical protein
MPMVSAKYLLLVPMVVSCALRVDADVVSVVHGPQQGAWHYGGFGDFPPTTFFPEVVAPAAPLLFDSTITGPGANISQAATGVSYNEGDDFGAINTFPGTFLSQSAPAGGNDPATLWIFGEAEYTLDVASDVFVTWDFPVSAVVPPGSVGEYHMNTFIQGSGWVFDESGEVVPDNWAKNYLIDHVFTSSDTVRFSNFEFVDRVKTVGGHASRGFVHRQFTNHSRPGTEYHGHTMVAPCDGFTGRDRSRASQSQEVRVRGGCRPVDQGRTSRPWHAATRPAASVASAPSADGAPFSPAWSAFD